MSSNDGLTPTVRNIIFSITTTAIYGCLLYSWLDLEKNEREEALYLTFFILGTLAVTIILGLVLYDSFTNRDLVKENLMTKDREKSVNENFKGTMMEELGDFKNRSFLNKKYYPNSFHDFSELWRTLLIAVLAISTFIGFIVIYLKHPTSTRDNAGYIILVSVATIAMLVHVAILIFQLWERSNISKELGTSLNNREDISREIEKKRIMVNNI